MLPLAGPRKNSMKRAAAETRETENDSIYRHPLVPPRSAHR
jgi:hypothetical protein